MTGVTHLIGGVLAGVGISIVTEQPTAASIIGLVTLGGIGGLYPDIDIPTSKLGSKVKLASKAIYKTAGHRGMFHAPLLYVIAYAAICIYAPKYQDLALAFFGGCMSHLLLDSLNVQGIPVFWPFKSKLSLMQIKVGGKTETMLRWAMTLLSVAAVYMTYVLRQPLL